MGYCSLRCSPVGCRVGLYRLCNDIDIDTAQQLNLQCSNLNSLGFAASVSGRPIHQQHGMRCC